MSDSIDDTKRTPLDEQLDIALAKYAAVEPRGGLEQRILANLKAQQRPATGVSWWRWAGVLAAALVIITLLVWRMEKHSRPELVRHPGPSQRQAQPKVADKSPGTKRDQQVIQVAVPKPRSRVSPAPALAATQPKLDQFPSPQPLSQEELVLARYAMEFPAEATLIAKAQDEYEREVQREMRSTDSGIRPSGLDKSER